MVAFADYAEKYSTVRMARDDDGILEVTLHTGGGSMKWDFIAHEELPRAFYDIAEDRGNRVVILTGTGEDFIGPRVSGGGHPLFKDRPPVDFLEKLVFEGRQCLLNFLNIQAPVISAINGPAWRHSELPLLGDIVLATEDVCFQDSGHYYGGLVPGDGMHVVFPLLIGANRARYFLLTGQVIDARQALDLGLVAELLPRDGLMPRARELARELAAKPASLVRLTRAALTEHIKREMQSTLGFGLYVEMLAMTDRDGGK
jgi:enoyl-CoA hydratase/carnithine racemase